jgi:DNA-binding MarR family transcriptional regulator
MARATKASDAPHARIYFEWLSLPAWRSLSPLASKALVVIVGHYRPSNPYARWSVRRLADALECGKSAAATALEQLEDRGWLVPLQRSRLGKRDATTYRLTMHPDPETEMPATREFVGWRPLLKARRDAGKPVHCPADRT